MAHSDSNHLLLPRQSAYRRRFSTETAVLLVYNDIIRAVDQGYLVAMALLDLSCAFDTVDHVTLLSILSQRFSITDQALAWFQSYLTDRCQVFTTDSTQSAPIALSSGIPQGSGLGPTQFIAYTEDTTNIFPSHNIQYHLFADDTQSHGHCSIPDIRDLVFRLQECIKDLARSYASHRLQLNPSKSDFIWFGSRSSLSKIPPEFHSLTVSGITAHSSKSVRDLGVFLDSELQMKVHVNKLVSICYYHLRRLFQLRSVVSQDVMKHLVTALVLARIDSCNSVLVNLPASTIAPLQRVQNTAARLVLGLKRRAHITPALKKLHWLPVRQRITFKIATLVHRVQHQDCPPYLCDLVHFTNADCNRSRLRSATSGAATVVRTRTNLGQRAFSVAAPSIWNSLPPSLRLIDSHTVFRRQLKTYLFNLVFD